MHRVMVFPGEYVLTARRGENLLSLLRRAGLAPDAPCGGSGSCGKCRVLVDGAEVSACQTAVEGDMIVTLPDRAAEHILTQASVGPVNIDPCREGYLLAVDIGTTTAALSLMDGKNGAELAVSSFLNPQTPFGADVISRIRHALTGHMDELTIQIRNALTRAAEELCRMASIAPSDIGVVAVVGNPAMQQLFLGISPKNLAEIPFAPVLRKAQIVPAAPYLSCCKKSRLLIVPDISGYIGADTVGCILATGQDRADELALLVDIGTNGEMVLGNRHGMVACSAAAGPALEGANIKFGMRGQTGAIDHVRVENGVFCCNVIGGGEATGICGSGLIDAVAAALDAGLINERGRILNEEHVIRLTDRVYLTQDDIREVQMAKGAVAAGIELMVKRLGITVTKITRVYLAGAFGTFLDPVSACRIGLLPPELLGRITAVGNAALGGAKRLACDRGELNRAEQLVSRVELLELAGDEAFRRCFARNMRF